MTKLFLLHGYIGSGKTTFAKALAEKENAILFSVDEWVRQLYGWNPQEMTFDEMNRRVKELIWHMASKLLLRGINVVFDWGFWTRSSRDEARDFARDNKAEAVFYHIMCDEAVALARTLQRTESKEEGSVFIDEPAFYSLKARYEAPDDDESMIVVDTTSY